jgi:hypothetical protein
MQPLPHHRRRYPYAFLTFLVLTVVTSTGAIMLSSGPSGPNRAGPHPTFPRVEHSSPTVSPPGPTAGPSLSPSPGAKPRRVSPTRSPSSRPPSPSQAVAPVNYRVTRGLCKYVDFTPISSLSSPPAKPSVESYHRGFEGSTNVLYVCHGYTDLVLIRNIEVMVYDDAVLAAAAYADDKSTTNTIEPIRGLSEDAYGWPFDPTAYVVQALHRNVTFKIVLFARDWVPDLAQLRAIEIEVAQGVLGRLPHG